jgi:hypothetical protein
MMTGSDHLAWIGNDTGSAMRAPSSQLTGFIIPVMNPSQTLQGLIEAGVVMLVLVQALRDQRRRRRSALGANGIGAVARFVVRFGSSVGLTPSPAVERRCGIRLDPGGRRHAGTVVGLDCLARPLAVP